ncbi:hypothetical protein ABIB25_005015 [Nakamurella sp. UYEF19]|uniref:DUF4328 domain-containing protein n=1 Tax=Nakamurella sp. UYEF19 TaxID=1756392 RepID=UPI00339333C5
MRTCVYCSAALPVQRWRAQVPPGVSVTAPPRPGRRRTYYGPPSYRGQHPRWGFPPVVWRGVTASEPPDTTPPLTLLRMGAVVAALTALAAVAAAGGEIWRYTLLLRGRTEFLSGPVVSASDRLVTTASAAAAVLAVITAAVVVPVLVRLHGVAARRVGLVPARTAPSVLARLVVPGWNVLGLGVVLAEIDGPLTDPVAGALPPAVVRPKMSKLSTALWVMWIVDSVLVLVTLAKAFGRSDQSMADTVELHVVVDLVGVVVAVLLALVLARFRRLLRPPGGRYPGWRVRPPAPTRANTPSHTTALDAAVPEAGPSAPAEAGPPASAEAGPSAPAEAGPPAPAEAGPSAPAEAGPSAPAEPEPAQLAMLNVAPVRAEAGPVASQATVSAKASGDQPDAAAAPEPTTITPTP